MKMLTSKQMALLLVLASFFLIANMDTISSQSPLSIITQAYDQRSYEVGKSRLLQSTSLNSKFLNESISNIINLTNAARISKTLRPLSVNSSLQTIIKQWAVGIRPRLTLTKYMQLYGMQSSQTYTFAPIPLHYITAVVRLNSPQLTSPDYANIAIYSNSNDNQNYEVIVVLQGGIEQLEKVFTKEDVARAVYKINKELDPPNIKNNDNEVGNTTDQNAVKHVNVSIVENKDGGNNTHINANVNINVQINQQTTVNINNSNVQIGPINIIQETPKIVPQEIKAAEPTTTPEPAPAPTAKAISTPASTVETNIVPVETLKTATPVPIQTTIKQTPITVQTQPLVTITPVVSQSIQQIPATTVIQPQPVQPLQAQPPISTALTPSTSSVTTIPSPSTPSAPTPSAPISTSPNIEQPKSNPVAVAISIMTKPIQEPKPLPIVSTFNISAPRTTSPYIPLSPFPRPNNSNPTTLPLITLTNPSNLTTFDNIILSHNVPSTFVKNEIFPFRGSITIPNPNGIRVNVIFSRVSDQRRMAFSQQLPKNQTTFEILALLNVSGSYYLSIFVGQRGTTTYKQYTIIPSFFGQIVSRTPKPIKSSSLIMKDNDLWLEWTFSDVVQPPITNIIFSQDNGPRLQFLLSNFETSLQVPFSQFSDFNIGITNIEISQAFSNSESAAARTSDYSAPYNLIFNATTHNFAQVSNLNTFQPIPLRASLGDTIILNGPVKTQLQNKAILFSPKNQFIFLYIDGNSSNLHINPGATVQLPFTLNETGVYILEVNGASGQAIINVPIYVGDIYPLLPDFMDLTPNNIDTQALNQPSNIDERRSLVQVMINDIRKRFGAKILYLDNKLSDLAQNYSFVMIQQNFVSHVDKQGRGATQRALAAGITENVAENIAVNQNLTLAQLMLQRSPSHLKTIVDPRWTRVGLGIAQNSNGQYYLTQEFASRDMQLYPLTQSELQAIQSQIAGFIISKYPSLSENRQLGKDLDNYRQLSTQPDIMAYLSSLGYRGFGISQVQVAYNGGNYMPQLTSGDSFKPKSSAYTRLGVSASYNQGKLSILVAYD